MTGSVVAPSVLQALRSVPGRPPPHRRRRPAQPRRDRAVSLASGLAQQRRADHRCRVRPPHQRVHQQQHMRHRADPATAPTRPHPHRRTQTPQQPRPGRAPRDQHPTARTAQFTGSKAALDRSLISTYRQHRRPPTRQQPSRAETPIQEREGCTHQNVITVPSEHQNGQLHQELPVQHVQDRCLHGRYILTPSVRGHRAAPAQVARCPADTKGWA